jgi:hypothetical protein
LVQFADAAAAQAALDGQPYELGGSVLKIKRVDMKSELHSAGRDGQGALAEMWSKTVQGTGHGKHLLLLQQKLVMVCRDSRPSGMALFKTFREKAGSATNVITREEFIRCIHTLGLPMNADDAVRLFMDMDTTGSGDISVEDFRINIAGAACSLARVHNRHSVSVSGLLTHALAPCRCWHGRARTHRQAFAARARRGTPGEPLIQH